MVGMSDLTEHYRLLLGLDEAWVVEQVDLALAAPWWPPKIPEACMPFANYRTGILFYCGKLDMKPNPVSH
jgi:hypothetical protein